MRKIIHLDMDAFFASVEQNDYNLFGKPVIVGGISDRGVVSTCSYEARKFGVHSAMPTYLAKKKCPHGIFMPVRMKRYKEISNSVFEVFYEYTSKVEPLSLDEAYLDVTSDSRDTYEIAKLIKQKVFYKTGLTISAGVSYNKFLAKLASDWNKPNGIKVITKDMMPNILFPLSISKVYGLGKKSVSNLNNIGIFTIEDLYQLSKDYLVEFLGRQGENIYDRIRGIDNRPVCQPTASKSIGRETTLSKNTHDMEMLKNIILQFSDSISLSLVNHKLYAKTITIKYKTADFKTHTKSKTLDYYIQTSGELYKTACEILDNIIFSNNIRLIGLTVSHIDTADIRQITIFDVLNQNK